jgi:hypothetical protein
MQGRFNAVTFHAAAWGPRKAGHISCVMSKYILYVRSYISISAMSALEYAYVAPQDLFLHWAQICLKHALILNIRGAADK